MGRRRSGLFLILLIAGLAGCSRHPAGSGNEKPMVAAGEVGSAMPEFSVTDLHGHPLASRDLRGKVVIVDFWATWCQPCRKEMPGYQKLVDKYGSQGFAVVGFKATMMMDTEPPLQFAKEAGVKYPLAIGTPSISDLFGGIEGLPTTFIYGRDGILRQKIIGFEYTEVIEKEVRGLIGEK